MPVIQDTVRQFRSPVRVAAIAERIDAFLTQFPQFNHLSALSSKFMADWSPKTLLNALVAHGISEDRIQCPVKGQKYQTAESMLSFLIQADEETAASFLSHLRSIREVSDMDNAIVVEDEEGETEATEALADLI